MLVLVDQVDQGMAVVCVGRSVGGVGVGSCRLGWCRSNSRQVGFRFGWVGRLGRVTVGLLSLGSGQVGLWGRSGLLPDNHTTSWPILQAEICKNLVVLNFKMD